MTDEQHRSPEDNPEDNPEETMENRPDDYPDDSPDETAGQPAGDASQDNEESGETAEQDASDASQDNEEPGETVEQDADGASQDNEEPGETAEQNPGNQQNAASESSDSDIKIVLSIKSGQAMIAAQKPGTDPIIESFQVPEITLLAQEVPAFMERAISQWEESPQYPKHVKPRAQPRQTRRTPARTQPPATPAPAPEAAPAPAPEAPPQPRTMSMFDE